MKTIVAFIVSVCVLLGQVAAADDGDFPIVVLPQGTLKGRKVIPENLSPYYSFLGIPYAKPPVGNLRFQAPVAAEAWNGTLEAFLEGNICKQPRDVFTGDKLVGDEDCLFLNVYTPQLAGSGPLLPVMVWIHGGGYIAGSGNKKGQGPEFLLDKGIVYVSLNYRLGIFGFLSTEDEVVTGNAGMKDQVLALRWVKQNIAAFGGDPLQVTIVGESAGGSSVHYHMLSPMSEGLFHGAIAESGSVPCPWSIGEKPRKNAFLVGKALGFSSESSHDLVEFLRSVDAETLLASSLTTVNEEDQYRLMKTIHTMPVVEPEVPGEMAFISENPLLLLEQGKFHKVPYLTGVNSAEGLLLTGFTFEANKSLQEIDKNFTKIFKPELRFCREESCGDTLIAEVRSFYFGDEPLVNTSIVNVINMWTDIYFVEGSFMSVKEMSLLSSSPVYFYHFTYDGGLGQGKVHHPLPFNFSGAAHGDELGYIFEFGVQVSNDSLDAKVRSRMVTMWTDFIKTGNPTPHASEEFPAWLPFNVTSSNYMEIGSQLQMKTGFNKKRMDFWEDLYRSHRTKSKFSSQ